MFEKFEIGEKLDFCSNLPLKALFDDIFVVHFLEDPKESILDAIDPGSSSSIALQCQLSEALSFFEGFIRSENNYTQHVCLLIIQTQGLYPLEK
jgi:hypothetical protein